ncbi:MAG: hypothetical protein JO006_16920 [Paucibacter sp.]|nr:hypothetical protein [Roseateles sp.]
MSTYVIHSITEENGEVALADIRMVVRTARPDQFGLDDGEVMAFHDVASLIRFGHAVHVVRWIGPGEFEPGSRVGIKPGQIEHLLSVDAHGVPNGDLMALPRLRM